MNSLEGLTWPDTYFIGANDDEAQILQKIVTQFDAKADALGLAGSGAANGGQSPYQAIVTASLIEAEAGSVDDMPLISAVIVNRLKDNTPLQIDATLCYAKGGCPPVPTDADRKIDSPYNTYKVTGLPPTPISDGERGGTEGRARTGTGAVQVLRVGHEREDLLRDHAAGAREERRQGPQWGLTASRRDR